MEGSSKVFQIPYLHQLIGLLILLRFQVIESHNKNCRPIQDNWQTHRQHNTQRQKLKAFLRRSGIRQWCPLLPGYLIQYWKFQLQKSDKKIYNRHANAMLSHFSCVRLCVTPQTAAHQAALSLRFSRQEHGVGCHFLLQCMKVKSESEVAQSCPTLRDPMDCSLPGSSVHRIFQARVLEWGAYTQGKKGQDITTCR